MSNYFVYLYPGYGVELTKFVVHDISNEQEAIEKLCSSLSSIFFRPIEDLEQDEIEYCEQHPDLYMYVDSTCYGGKCGYLDIRYMKMEQEV